MTNGPSVAVAFGGGGARGYAHIHIIETLNELGIKPVALSGASIGSIMGSAMASGMSGKEIREFSLELAAKRADALGRFIRSKGVGITKMFSDEYSLAQLDALSLLKIFLPPQIKSTFEELLIPLTVSTTDYYNYQELIFNSGDLLTAVAASSSIPAAFKPVKFEGRFLVDGGIFNPVPFDHLMGKADIIIGVEVLGTPIGDPSKAPNFMDTLYGASQLMMQAILTRELEKHAPHILLRPAVSKFRVQDFFKAKQILEESKEVREELKRKLDSAIENYEKSK